MQEDEKIPFTSHLEELRHRIIVCVGAIIAGLCISYYFKEKLFDFLVRPLVKVMGKEKLVLIYTSLPEAFFTYFKVALIGGVILASPIIMYQFWMFMAPGLYRDERRLFAPLIILSVIFFIGGASFGYFVVFPVGFEFFLEFATENIKAMPAMGDYLNFASTLLLAFGLIFELPLVIVAMVKMGIVTVPFLRKNRKYATLLFFIIAAILTPTPDAVNHCLMAIPLCLLYEVSIFGAILFVKKKPVEEDSADVEEPHKEKEADGI